MRALSPVVFAVAMLAMQVASGAVSSQSAQALLQQIEQSGGSAVYRHLGADEAAFDRVTRQIETGDAAWLKVAAALRPFADAAGAESLDFAVARALPKEPSRVLRLMAGGYGLVCTSPYIEPAPGVAEAYAKEALRALASVKEPALKPVALQCANGVRLP